jgi:NAD(P)H-hydrate repair Nnr-like enzyme with NAD(P)H-hydrate dehydratase domain
VLTGVIAALIARGLGPLDAAAAGVFIHGAAADLAAGDEGMDNIISTDLIDYLPQAFMDLESDQHREERI